jgi:hypothetical protein
LNGGCTFWEGILRKETGAYLQNIKKQLPFPTTDVFEAGFS